VNPGAGTPGKETANLKKSTPKRPRKMVSRAASDVAFSDPLGRAIDAEYLPGLVRFFYGDAFDHYGAFLTSSQARCCCTWRGEKTPSFDMRRTSNRWVWNDRGTGEGGDCFKFLVLIVGLSKKDAARILLERNGSAGKSPRFHVAPLPVDILQDEFRREHPDADESFFEEYGLLRAKSHPSVHYYRCEATLAHFALLGADTEGWTVVLAFLKQARRQGSEPDWDCAVGQLVLEILAEQFAAAFRPCVERQSSTRLTIVLKRAES
jgi:hypothetical protein